MCVHLHHTVIIVCILASRELRYINKESQCSLVTYCKAVMLNKVVSILS